MNPWISVETKPPSAGKYVVKLDSGRELPLWWDGETWAWRSSLGKVAFWKNFVFVERPAKSEVDWIK